MTGPATTTPHAGDDGRIIFLFDGECGLCNAGVDFVLRRERNADTLFAPQQLEAGRRLLAAIGAAGLADRTVVVIDAGRPLTPHFVTRRPPSARPGCRRGGRWHGDRGVERG